MLVIYNAKIVDRDTTGIGFVVCENGKISCVQICNSNRPQVTGANDSDYFDAKGLTLMPAFIDMHAHFRYPGQPEKEDLNSGLEAAKNGGYGTLVLMPNTVPVISSCEQAMSVMNEARAKKMSNIFQTVSITENFNGDTIEHLEKINSKDIPIITEDGKDVLNSQTMLHAMQTAAEKGIIVSCHSEDPTLANLARALRSYALELMSNKNIPAWGVIPENLQIPQNTKNQIIEYLSDANELLRVAEDTYTYRNLELAHLAKCKVHIAHVSTKGAIDAVRSAKQKGYDCTAEVTPHHLALTGVTAPEIFALVNPPLRAEEDRTALIQALRDGTADTISTDHAPHTAKDKERGAPGFTGSETAFAVCNTILVKQEGFSINKLSELMSCRAAEILKLNKGLIKEGFDADLVLVDENQKWTVNSKEFKSKGKASPFDGKELIGKVKTLFVAGRVI